MGLMKGITDIQKIANKGSARTMRKLKNMIPPATQRARPNWNGLGR